MANNKNDLLDNVRLNAVNSLTHLLIITHAKRCHYKTIFERFKFDMKKTWSIISENLNKNVRNPIPDKMTINGVNCRDKQVIARSGQL